MHLNIWKAPTGQVEVVQDVESTAVGKYRWVQEDADHAQKWHIVGKGTTGEASSLC